MRQASIQFASPGDAPKRRWMSWLILCFATITAESPASQVKPLHNAHAHNDYHHSRPLLDALGHGFCSVEADIFLVNGRLIVGHSRDELRDERTLSRLYLDPLRERMRKNGGRIYSDGPTLTLLIDIKSSGPATYRALHKPLARYAEMLTTVENEKVRERAVTVVISGNRPWELISAGSPRYASIDGRVGDLNSNVASHLITLISDNWGNHFSWRGDGPFPDDERMKLRRIVSQAHSKGRRVLVLGDARESGAMA